jgi:hypothetical protein
LRRCDEPAYFVEIALMTGCKIVQADDMLIKLQQRFQQIGSDKTGRAGDKPPPRALEELLHC